MAESRTVFVDVGGVRTEITRKQHAGVYAAYEEWDTPEQPEQPDKPNKKKTAAKSGD